MAGTEKPFPARTLQAFGIIYNAHHALDDARACGLITAMAARKSCTATVQELLCKCRLKMGKF